MTLLIWDPDNPAQGDYLQPAKLRENLAIFAAQGLGVNLLGDPTFICWPDTDGGLSLQGYWDSNGTGGATSRETGAGNYLYDGMSAKLVYGSAALTLYQHILSTNADMTPFKGRYVSGGCWMKSSSADSHIRFNDGTGVTYSANHPGDSTWQWLSVTHLISSGATYLSFQPRVAASGTAYVDGATVVFGQIPPPDYIPARWKTMDLGLRIPGDPVTTGWKGSIEHTKPFVVRSTYLGARSNASGQALIVDLNHYDAGWSSMYSTRPDIDTGQSRGYAEPDGTYRLRCFQGRGDGATYDDGVFSIDVDQAPTSGAKHPVVQVTCHAWDRPLDLHNDFNDLN